MNTPFEYPGCRVFESALFRTTTTLVTGDDHLLLVDPTWLPHEIEAITEHVADLAPGRECFLAFTHSDYDHILGFGRFPEFRTVASGAFVRNADPDEPLEQIRTFDDEYYVTRPYPITYPRIDLPVEGNGVTLELGEETYLGYQAAGHNPDGLILLNRDRGILIVGDYLSNVEFPYVYHSVAEYRRTLDRLEGIIREERVELLISGHGDPTTDPEEMHRRIRDSRSYLDELEESVVTGRAFDLDRLFTRYRFPRIMRKFHAGNVKLMQQHVRSQPSSG